MSTTLRIVGLALAIGLAGFGCSSDWGDKGGEWSKQGSKSKKKTTPVAVVELETVSTGSVRETLNANAVIDSESMADIIPMTSGIVVSLHQDEGDAVRKGALLAVLDNVSLDASAERAAAEVARLEQQQRELTELAARGAVSDRELSDVTWNLENARTSLREAATTRGQTRLTAPFDGVVAARNVRVGQLASGSAAAFTVVDLERLRVVAQVPERDLARISVGQPAVLQSAYDESVTTDGTVTRIAPVVDSQSGTFRVTIDLEPEQTALRPGQYVNIAIEVDRKNDVMVVASQSILYEAGEPVVYIFDEATEEDLADDTPDWGGRGGWGGDRGDQSSWWSGWGADEEQAEDEDEAPEGPVFVARRRPIKLGLDDDSVTEILAGLESGDRVITVGQHHLRDGARVRDAAVPIAQKDEPSEDAEATEADADTPVEDKG